MAFNPKFKWGMIPARLNGAFLLVFITYNPTGYSYVHWLIGGGGGPLPLKIAVGIFLLILLYLLANVAWSVFRISGLVTGAITAGLFATYTLSFALAESYFESFEGIVVWISYLVLMTVAIVVGFGLSWSQMMFRLSGQEYKRPTKAGL